MDESESQLVICRLKTERKAQTKGEKRHKVYNIWNEKISSCAKVTQIFVFLFPTENDEPPHAEFRPQHAGLHSWGNLLAATETQPAGRHLKQTAKASTGPSFPTSAGSYSTQIIQKRHSFEMMIEKQQTAENKNVTCQ